MTHSVLISRDPAATLVPLARFRVALRHDLEAEEDYVQGILDAATLEAEDYLQIALGRQTREMRLQGTPTRDIVKLDFGPVLEVESVKYVDANGVLQTVAEADYASFDGQVYPVYGKAWPAASLQFPDSFRVRYVAGLVDPTASPVATLSEQVQIAICLLGQRIYDRNPQSEAMLLKTAHALLDTMRVGQGV